MEKNKKTVLNRIFECFLIFGVIVVLIFIIEFVLLVFHVKPILLKQDFYLTCFCRNLDDDIIMISPQLLNDEYYKCKEKTLQIITIGDSFTEGFPVEWDETYPAMLAKIFEKNKIKANVINCGIGNTGPDQHLKLLKNRILKKTNPDIVVWQLYANDIWDNVSLPVYSISSSGTLQPLSGRSHWLYKRQKFFNAIPLPFIMKKNSIFIRLILKIFERGEGSQIPMKYKKDPHVWGWKKFELEVDEIKVLSQKYGFKLFFLVITPQAVYLSDNKEQSTNWNSYWGIKEYEAMHDLFSRQDNFIETNFLDSDFSLITEAFPGQFFTYAIEKDLFSGDDVDHNLLGDKHLNRFGYWLLARKIGTYIISHLNESTE